ncbi:MAG: SufS family cysteine desulfurase [Bdellovibrionaceae bacterium]|jgi:cysteine desulfurase / selenocysteine lyase|nr:SufS family cysteine desulfurase [Pseudobdellovibrionaceae bacterium]
MNLYDEIKNEFPILTSKVNGKPLAYFDNAATTLTPVCVAEEIKEFDILHKSNVHRGIHYLSQKATERFEVARDKVQAFLNAKSVDEVVFTSGTTDSINLMAFSYGEAFINEGDEIILSQMEHHSNIVPWQLMAERKKAKIKFIPLTDIGELDFEAFKRLISAKTKILSMTYCSNTLGTVNPVKDYINYAKQKNIHVHIDAAQAVNAFSVDVQELDCDFLSFSGHKMFAAFGVGVFYGKYDLLDQFPPFKGGGSMITDVREDGSDYMKPPQRFEAGTPNVSGAIGLARAIDFMNDIGFDKIHKYETDLMQYKTAQLAKIEGLQFVGTSKSKIKINSFVFPGIHNSDLATLMDQEGVAVRSGKHCTNLIMKYFDIPGTIRASLSIYNSEAHVDQLCQSIVKARGFF